MDQLTFLYYLTGLTLFLMISPILCYVVFSIGHYLLNNNNQKDNV
jgi:hypothetical protein